MNQKLLSGLLVLVLCLTMLTGCATGGAVGTTPNNTENIFEPATDTTAGESTAPSKQDNDADFPASMYYGLAEGPLQDENGYYCAYEGGEMRLPVLLDCTGIIRKVGVGILLFLDGQVQPYRVDGEESYSYLHTFYPNDEEKTFDLYFTPVTGQKGDAPDLYMVAMQSPNYLPSQGPSTSMAYNDGAGIYRTPLRFLADPPKAEFPENTIRLKSQKIAQEDCSYQDVAGWTDEDWKTKVSSALIVNDTVFPKPVFVYGITPEVPARLHYEIWGAEAEKNNLIVFVDNVPVYGPDGKPLELQLETGKKTVVDMELDMTGFSGESAVYAIRVPTNYIASGTGPSGDLKPEQVWFLLAGEKPAG